MQHGRCRLFALTGIVITGLSGASAVPVFDLLPDVITNPEYLLDTEVRDDIQAGRVFLTLSNATANVGSGPLEVYGVAPKDNGDESTQPVMQRIYRSDGSSYEVEAGVFVYHPAHEHTHLANWARYRLREVLEGDGVGPVVARSEKTSFCLLDSLIYDDSLPGFPGFPVYVNCGVGTQGISVGYQDLYDKSLPDQWIDITGVPGGTYWLESEVDPANHIIEMDETNNTARVKLIIDLEDSDPGPNPQGIIAALLALLQRIVDFLRVLFGRG
ncbi:MAG: hypothetical protein IT364_05670 [Candidatus Hydrogenedentes bacterium]|nr:hypothetical protein [Candidatus Hydrogenedentota bacterium]